MYLSYAWSCVFIARLCYIVWKQRFELIDAHDRANKPHGRVQLSGKFYWGILIHTHDRVFFLARSCVPVLEASTIWS